MVLVSNQGFCLLFIHIYFRFFILNYACILSYYAYHYNWQKLNHIAFTSVIRGHNPNFCQFHDVANWYQQFKPGLLYSIYTGKYHCLDINNWLMALISLNSKSFHQFVLCLVLFYHAVGMRSMPLRCDCSVVFSYHKMCWKCSDDKKIEDEFTLLYALCFLYRHIFETFDISLPKYFRLFYLSLYLANAELRSV